VGSIGNTQLFEIRVRNPFTIEPKLPWTNSLEAETVKLNNHRCWILITPLDILRCLHSVRCCTSNRSFIRFMINLDFHVRMCTCVYIRVYVKVERVNFNQQQLT